MASFRLVILVFVVAKCGVLALAQGTPNLLPYQPQGWSDKVVVSTQTGTHTDNSPLKTTDQIYVDWAVLNNGTASAPSGFQVALYVDGVLKQSWTKSTPQDAKFYSYVEDYPLGALGPGTHSIRLVADSTGVVAESNETDNEYTKTVSVTAPPNLTPFQPTGWSDKIVISTLTGTSTDSGVYRTTDALYVDWAVINNGLGPTSASFQVKLYVDGAERIAWNSSPTLESGFYNFIQDYPVGSLSAGVHTIRIQADPFNAVSETNEADNDYTKTISVVQATQCFTLLTAVNPAAGGTITKNQAPNCGAAISSSTESLSTAEPTLLTANAVTNLPPVPKRSQATVETFARLREKVRSQRRVSVIVGLGTDFRPEGTLVDADAVTIQRTSISRAQDALVTRMSKFDVTVTSRFWFIPYMTVEVDAAGLDFLDSSSEVASISENEMLRPLLAESVPLVGAPTAWNLGFSGAGQTVAILDSGVDKTHPFLAGKVVSEACYSANNTLVGASSTCPNGVEQSTSPGSGMPCLIEGCGHGTHVAGIAAGRGTGSSGVARDGAIVSIQTATIVNNPIICAPDPSPCLRLPSENVILGLQRVYELATTGAFRIAAANLSIGGGKFTSACDGSNPEYKAAIDNLRLIGIPTVVASGNEGFSDGLASPACISSAVSVGSTDDGSFGTTANQISSFSNSAYFLNLLAPGQRINSSVPGGGFANSQGTSMAAPHVAGAWAVLKSKTPNATVSQVLSALTTTGVPIVDLRNGITKPRIQVDAALNALAGGESYTSGSTVTLTATPRAGYQFKNWSGCDSVSGSQCTVAMTRAATVTANFEPITTATPDLVLTSLTGSSSVAIGGQISLSAELRNQGTGNTDAFRLGFYLSTDSSVTGSDILIAVCGYSTGLAAGFSSSCSGSVGLPASLAPGSYYLGAIVDDQGKVNEGNENNNTRTGPTVLVTQAENATIFVPIVLSAAGLNNSFFTSEMTLTNRGNQDATLHFTYTASIGTGTGEATASLPKGQQRIIPDAIAYLQSIGIPLPSSGNRGGTLAVRFTGLSSAADAGVVVRTTSAVSGGRAGLAYLGMSSGNGLTETAYLYGLQQNLKDRSNVAIQHMGGPSTGTVTLRLTVFSGTSSNPVSKTLTDEVLSPGEFRQISGILAAEGLSLTNGYVRIEKVSGTAPYYAYAVVNDQANSDGSFVAPILESTLAGKTSVAVPVIVEANTFTSELVVTNWSTTRKTLNLEYVADAIQTADSTARFRVDVDAGEQLIYPDFVQVLRESAINGVGPRGPAFAGALFGRPSTGDLSGISIAARTSSPGGGGRYGLFYSGVTNGRASATSAWVYGLQQNAESRSNLALINTGEIDASTDTFRIELFDGATGAKVNTVEGVSVGAKGFTQIGTILAQYAAGTTQGYAHVTRISGNNPFIAYGVINDGASPGERTGDGAFVVSVE